MPLTRIERKLVPALVEFERSRTIDASLLRLAVAFGMMERISPVPLRGSSGAYLDHALTHKGRLLIERGVLDERGDNNPENVKGLDNLQV